MHYGRLGVFLFQLSMDSVSSFARLGGNCDTLVEKENCYKTQDRILSLLGLKKVWL